MRSAVGLTSLTALSLWLRTRSLDGSLWIDEALSRGIASHPVTEIPGLLKMDGSPPLYYVLLHAWMTLAGDGEVALRALSVVFAVAAVPAAWWAGSVVAGRTAAWFAAVLAAVNPFLTVYGQEARMYSLVALLSLLLVGAFVRGFVDGVPAFRVAVAVLLVLLLYTHTWAVFVVLGFVAAVGFLCLRDRALAGPAALTLGAALLCFVPWLPTLIDQAVHTGAPWSRTPTPVALFAGFPNAFDRGLGAVVVVAVAAAGLVWHRPEGRLRRALVALVLLGGTTLVAAWVASQAAPSWANRYLAVIVGPAVVLAATGLSRARWLGPGALVGIAALWVLYEAPASKSNADALAAAREMREAPLVVSTQPEQVPLLAYYVRPETAYATPLGPVGDPLVTDWRDALDRLREARPERTLEPLVADLAPGERLVLVEPVARGPGWEAPWQQAVLETGDVWRRWLEADDRLRMTRAVEPAGAAESRTNVRALVFERV